MPLVIKMAHDYQSQPDFQVIGISLPFDPLPAVQTYAAEKGMNFTVAYDGGKTAATAFGTQVYPTSVLINKKGEVLKTFVGEPDFAELYRQIDEELAK